MMILPRRNERMIVVLLAFLSRSTAFSFVSYQRRRQPLRLYNTRKSSDNDNLVWDHSKNLPLTPQLTLWHEEDEKKDSWKEWHFSFSRNGFTDFLPQFSENINCLFVGGGDDVSPSCSRLPWEQEESHSQITRLLVGKNDPEILDQGKNPPDTTILEGRSFRDIVITKTKSLIPVEYDTIEPNYDCILDRGLANAFLSELTHDGSLLFELDALMQAASRAICDNGIYIMLTHQLLSTEIKEYLTKNGEILGMEWNFDLDGISSNEKGISVSVARKFFHGELPSVGGLATIDHDATPPRIMP